MALMRSAQAREFKWSAFGARFLPFRVDRGLGLNPTLSRIEELGARIS